VHREFNEDRDIVSKHVVGLEEGLIFYEELNNRVEVSHGSLQAYGN